MELNKDQLNSSYYNRVFAKQKPDYPRLFYYKWALKQVLTQENIEMKIGLDVGCGQGGFLALAETKNINIQGLDFSLEAINQTAGRTEAKLWFTSFENFDGWRYFDYFVLLETLEHLTYDLELLKQLPQDAFVVATVPGYDSEAHVRYFPKGVAEVKERYAPLFSEFSIENLGKSIMGFSGRVK